MKGITKKALSLVLAVLLVMSLGVTAFADDAPAASAKKQEGSGSGSGNFEGHLDKEVFEVLLPTSSGTAFNFKIDPEKLLAGRDNGAYVTDTDATLLFYNSSKSTDAQAKYSPYSDPIYVTNKSAVPVSVAFAAKLTGVKTSEKDAFTDKDGKALTDQLIYLQLEAAKWKAADSDYELDTSVEAVVIKPKDKDAADSEGTLTAKIDAVAASKFETAYDAGKATNRYTLKLKDDATAADFPTSYFRISGKSNSGADWSDKDESMQAYSLAVTWTVTPDGSASGPSVTLDSGLKYNISLNGAKSFVVNSFKSSNATATPDSGTSSWYSYKDKENGSALTKDGVLTLVKGGSTWRRYEIVFTLQDDSTVTWKIPAPTSDTAGGAAAK